jgi:hypothetical protein
LVSSAAARSILESSAAWRPEIWRGQMSRASASVRLVTSVHWLDEMCEPSRPSLFSTEHHVDAQNVVVIAVRECDACTRCEDVSV